MGPPPAGLGGISSIRQLLSSGIHPQGGRHSLCPPYDSHRRAAKPHGLMGNRAAPVLFPGRSQCGGRHSVTCQTGHGVADTPRHSADPLLRMESPGNRSVRPERYGSANLILSEPEPPQSPGTRRPPSSLVVINGDTPFLPPPISSSRLWPN